MTNILDKNSWDTAELITILDFIRYGITKASFANLYYGHGTESAFYDMQHLVLGSLGLPYDADPIIYNAKLTKQEREFLSVQLKRRVIENIPVPYLTKKAYFCGLEFYVDDRVLIPRSPIAELIENSFSPWLCATQEVNNILDLCTGSGCIAIALAYAFENAKITAVDLSQDALEVCKLNTKNHNLENQINIIKSDCFANLSNYKNNRFDIIVSNPPYVGHDEMQSLPAEYKHEPHMALYADNNGLSIVATILHEAVNYLTPNGILVVEVGNSKDALIAAYPHLPFIWLDFERGGDGVFLLKAEDLL